MFLLRQVVYFYHWADKEVKMKYFSKFLLIIFLSLIYNSKCSNETLSKSLQAEDMVINDLESYIESQESVIQMLRKKLLSFKVRHQEAVGNEKFHFSSEINRFLLIKRLSSDIDLMADITFKVANSFKSKINSYTAKMQKPSKDDLREAATKIKEYQISSNVPTSKMAKGRLSTEDCYQIGKQMNAVKIFSFAIEWLSEAMKRYDEYYDQHQVTAIEILEELVIGFIGSNQMLEAEKVVEKLLQIDSNSRVLKILKSSRKTEKLQRKRKIISLVRPNFCHSIQLFTKNYHVALKVAE